MPIRTISKCQLSPVSSGSSSSCTGRTSSIIDASLTKDVALSQKTRLTFWIGVFNALNNQIWSYGPQSQFLIDANITSQTFGQTDRPANTTNPRSMQVRAGFSF